MDEQNNTQNEETAITLADVILMHNIIAMVSRRGAFEAAEMEIVGTLFNKLKTFLPKTEEQQSEESTAETTNTSADGEQTQFEFVQEEASV
jgi:hypothetical protein